MSCYVGGAQARAERSRVDSQIRSVWHRNRVIKNLITQATTAADEYDEDGNLVKEGTGDLAAIREIFDRLEGKPRQQITGPDNGPVEVEFRTIEEVRAYLLDRVIDCLRLPPPPLRIVDDSKD